jgi:phage FluMu protein Com
VILLAATLAITVYAQFLPYLDDFWKGFSLGAVLVFLVAVLVFYVARKKQDILEPDTKRRAVFGCSNCQHPISIYPPDDICIKLLSQPCEQNDSVKFSVKCPHCKVGNIRYWDREHPSMPDAVWSR